MPTRPSPARLPPSPDPEAVLFSRLVARVLRWPCPKCGGAGLCACFTDAPSADVGRAESESKGDSK